MPRMRGPRCLSFVLVASFLALTAVYVLPARVRAQGMAPQSSTEQTSEAELELNRRARALTDQMMSPWCKGVSITQCSSGNAVGYREQVKAWLRSGLSEADIKRGFAQQFGEGQLAMPRGPMSLTVPLLILGFGAVVLLVLVRRLTVAPPASAASPQLSPEQYKKLEAELDSELRRRERDD